MGEAGLKGLPKKYPEIAMDWCHYPLHCGDETARGGCAFLECMADSTCAPRAVSLRVLSALSLVNGIPCRRGAESYSVMFGFAWVDGSALSCGGASPVSRYRLVPAPESCILCTRKPPFLERKRSITPEHSCDVEGIGDLCCRGVSYRVACN